MAIGLDVTKNYLDMRVGTLASELQGWCNKIQAIQRQQYDAAKLVSIGYSEAEAPSMVLAIAALVKVKDLSTGADNLPNAVNMLSLLYPVMGID